MEKGRLLVFVGVAALHVTAIAFFKYLMRQPVQRHTDVFSTWIYGEAPMAKPGNDPPPLKIDDSAKPAPVLNPIVQVESAPPQSDWYTASEQAVGATVMQEANEG